MEKYRISSRFAIVPVMFSNLLQERATSLPDFSDVYNTNLYEYYQLASVDNRRILWTHREIRYYTGLPGVGIVYSSLIIFSKFWNIGTTIIL